MATSTSQVATVCGLLLCLAGLHSAEGLQSGTLVLTEGGNSVQNATLLVVSQPSRQVCRRLWHVQHQITEGGPQQTVDISTEGHETFTMAPRRHTRQRGLP